MASAIGAALISTSLSFMVDKAMDNGKEIVKYIADKAVDKAVDKVMDKPMDKVMAMVVDKVDGIVNIERDISKLQTTLYMIQDIVQVAEEKQIDKQGNPTVFIQNWLRNLVDIAYEARDVLDDFNTFSSCIITAGEASNPVNFISSFMLSYVGGLSSDTSNIPLTVLNRLEKDIRSVRERFDEKKKEGETFATLKSVVGEGSESVKNRRPEVGPFINKQRDGLFLGRKKVQEEIMDKILEPKYDHVDVVVIWGMGGIGKTTLAQSIYNDERVKKVPRKWSCVGESKFCAKKVITKITGDSSTDDVESLQRKLVEKFEGNRFLIVLDDVWDVDGNEWNLLFNPLTEVGKGGLIIITRRERQLCDEITIQTAYNLPPLSEENSWSIFESCAYVNGKADSTSELKPIGEKIVKKLNGHPLALKVVGRSLLKKDSSTWKKFLESKFTKDDEVMSALRWSYNHLPPHLKTCFTYCALFPKDHVFDKKLLVQMWMAHDLIQKEEQEWPEDVGAQYFEELVNASLLQCVDGKYTMHDLIHDLALHVSNGEFATANSSLTNDQMETVRHITITRGEYSKVPRHIKKEKLLTLYTTDDETDDEIWSYKNYRKNSTLVDVFNQLKSIRVLVLSSEGIYEIPDCISELRHLRYLDVSETKVKSLPDSLCHLYNLQTLAAPHFALPLPIDIVNISSLRYVRASLSTCKGVGKLTSLQELSSIRVRKGDNIRELGDMQKLRGKLTIRGLENVTSKEDAAGALMEKQTLMDELELVFNLHLQKSTISEEVLDALGCPPNLTCLRIYDYTGVKSPSWMVDGKHKFENLQTLELTHCPKLESLGEFANFMTSLSRLRIYGCHGLKRLQLDALVSLKELKIERCSSLVQITSAICERLEIKSCSHLEKMDVARCDSLVVIKILKLEGCESLRSLISIDIHGMDSLEDLRIYGCPTLELAFELNISTDNTQVFRTLLHHEIVSLESLAIRELKGFENFDATEANNFCKLRSLKSLDISQCEDLKSLPPDFHKLSSLKSLSIKHCPQLQSLPPDFHKLSSLKELEINRCPQLQSLPPDFHKLSSLEKLKIYESPQLQSLPPDFLKLSSLKRLSIEHCPQLQSLPPDFHKLSSLESLSIKHCPQLQSLPPDFHKLSSLESLSIEHCPQLQSLPPDFHKLSSLEILIISRCPQLQSLPPDFHKLSSLKSLTTFYCSQLQSLPPDFHRLSSLKSLTIFDCSQLQSLPPDFHKLSSLQMLRIHKCPQLQSLPPDFHKLSSLKSLDIIHCPQLQSLPPDFHKLSSLKRLTIFDCSQLQSLPADGLPPSLSYLSIADCPLLYKRCKDESGLDWHKINQIPERVICRHW